MLGLLHDFGILFYTIVHVTFCSVKPYRFSFSSITSISRKFREEQTFLLLQFLKVECFKLNTLETFLSASHLASNFWLKTNPPPD